MYNVPYVQEHKMNCIQNVNILNAIPVGRIPVARLLNKKNSV